MKSMRSRPRAAACAHLGEWVFVLCHLLSAAACSSSDENLAIALFEWPQRGEEESREFYALPFPNDLRREADGTVDVSGHPRTPGLIADYLDIIDARVSGFSVNPTAYFRFTEPVDPSSLPESPEASISADASVYLVPLSPSARDQRIPLRVQFTETPGSAIGANWLAVQIFPGLSLKEESTYAVVVTDRVRNTVGESFAAAPDFLDLTSPEDAELVEGWSAYAPLREYLAQTDSRAQVISAAVFTTQSPSTTLRAARTTLRARPAPTFREIQKVSQTSSFTLYDGRWDAANFQVGEPPYQNEGGNIEVVEGRALVQRTEELRFALSVPTGAPPAAGWPVVLYSHGTGGDYQSFVRNRVAADLASIGVAGLSMDQTLHGPRNPSGLSPEVAFYNFLQPVAALGNIQQGAIDLFNQTYLAEVLQFSAGGQNVQLDPRNILFFGHSQGVTTGMPFFALEPAVKGAVLSGGGSLLYLTLLTKTEPINIASLLAAIILDQPLDHFNPWLALLQMYFDPGDPASYSRLVVQASQEGASPKSVLQSLGVVDRFTPIPSIKALAMGLGADVVGPELVEIEGLELAGGQVVAGPLSQNRGSATVGLVQYNEAVGSDGHFVAFDIPQARAQILEFIRSLAIDNRAVIVPRP